MWKLARQEFTNRYSWHKDNVSVVLWPLQTQQLFFHTTAVFSIVGNRFSGQKRLWCNSATRWRICVLLTKSSQFVCYCSLSKYFFKSSPGSIRESTDSNENATICPYLFHLIFVWRPQVPSPWERPVCPPHRPWLPSPASSSYSSSHPGQRYDNRLHTPGETREREEVVPTSTITLHPPAPLPSALLPSSSSSSSASPNSPQLLSSSLQLLSSLSPSNSCRYVGLKIHFSLIPVFK